MLIDSRLREPHAVPIPIEASRRLKHAVLAAAVGIDLEVVAGSFVVERIQIDADRIVPSQGAALNHLPRADLLGLAIPHSRGDVEIVAVVEDIDLGEFAGRAMIHRRVLVHVVHGRRAFPHRIIQHAVDHRRGRGARDRQHLAAACNRGTCLLGTEGRSGRESQRGGQGDDERARPAHSQAQGRGFVRACHDPVFCQKGSTQSVKFSSESVK